MIEFATTSDPIRLWYLRSVLQDAGVEVFVFDAAAGALWPGAIPARLMIAEEDAWRARCALAAAEPENES